MEAYDIREFYSACDNLADRGLIGLAAAREAKWRRVSLRVRRGRLPGWAGIGGHCAGAVRRRAAGGQQGGCGCFRRHAQGRRSGPAHAEQVAAGTGSRPARLPPPAGQFTDVPPASLACPVCCCCGQIPEEDVVVALSDVPVLRSLVCS